MILRAIILPCLFPPLGGFFEPATREGGGGVGGDGGGGSGSEVAIIYD
jgi:hypothetical protein